MNREALRQQMLMRALWRDDAALQGWVRAPARASASHGVAAYRGNAGALAERALGSAFPTIAALIGAESFAGLARHFWHEHPPVRGDVGEWGDALPAFIAASEQLAEEPYMADSARLDWAVHAATRAADVSGVWPPALDALTTTDPALLRMQLAAGAAVVGSRWPIATVWRAHHGDQAIRQRARGVRGRARRNSPGLARRRLCRSRRSSRRRRRVVHRRGDPRPLPRRGARRRRR